MSEWTQGTDFSDPQSRARLRARLTEPLNVDVAIDATAVSLASTWGLFSPRELDAGSRLLLEELARHWRRSPPRPDLRVCDLGCGYGPLGLWVCKRLGPAASGVLLDKDVTAVAFAADNARRNGLPGVEARLSDGFSAVPADARFDLVLSNVPAKIGREALYTLLLDAHRHLAVGGEIWVVTITGLRRFIEGAFRDVFDDYDKVKQGRDYTVARARRGSYGDAPVSQDHRVGRRSPA